MARAAWREQKLKIYTLNVYLVTQLQLGRVWSNTKSLSVLFLVVFLISLFACLGSLSPVQASGQVSILNNQSLIDQFGTYHVLGEVENVGDAPVSSVNITAAGYDITNTVSATSSTLADLEVLLPGEKSPFDVILVYGYDLFGQVYNYSLSFTYSAANSIPRQLEIVSNSSSIDISSGFLYVTGNITNLGPGTATHARVIATFYDSEGYVVWVDEAYSQPHDIMPAGNASFTLVLPDNTVVPSAVGYGLTAESDQYAMIPEYQCLFILPLLIVTTAALAVWRKKKT
jgi:hypothetical protein